MFAVKKLDGGYFQGSDNGVLFWGADNFLKLNTKEEAENVARILSKPSMSNSKCEVATVD